MSYTHPGEPDLENAVRAGKSPGVLSLDAEIALCIEIVIARVMSKIGNHIALSLGVAGAMGSGGDINVYATDGLDVIHETIAEALVEYFGEHSAKCLSEAMERKGYKVTKHTFITKRLPDGFYSAKLELGILMSLPKP